MPTYEYACKACGHNFEIVQSFSEDALTTCPACSEEQLRKVYNAAGIIFKGEGWHIKDYGDSSAKPTAPTSGDAGKSAGDATKSSTSKKGGDATTGSSSSTGGDGAARPAAS